MPTLFARQEIYDVTGSVCAYELLYRDSNTQHANIDASDEEARDKATSFVLSYLFTHLDIDTVIGTHLAYINFTRNHLLQMIPALLPKERIIIELLENTRIDESLLENMRSLSRQGYKFALDDFVFQEELIPLVDFADIIKIEVIGLNQQEIKKQIAPLAGFKGKLLAEKIENRNQLILCKELGFDLFQGFFLNYPNLIHGQVPSENKNYLLKLCAELYSLDIKIKRIEEIIVQFPKLSNRILSIANLASLHQGKKIESLMDAIQQLGLVQIRNWVSLILVSTLDDVAYDLLERTLIRAKVCQILARNSGIANPNLAYTIGMLSTFDAILDESMPSVLSKIQLSDELKAALLTQSGELGYLLTVTLAYEQANFNKLDLSKFTIEDFSQAYLQGIEYANRVMKILR